MSAFLNSLREEGTKEEMFEFLCEYYGRHARLEETLQEIVYLANHALKEDENDTKS